MDNHLLVEELKAAAPGAVKAIHDGYADGLFTYCWFVLRNTDTAQLAVRDSLIVAEAHVARLAEPDLLKPWLYALARVECLRRRPSPATDPDVTAAPAGEAAADAVAMARHAVMHLGPLEREALELSTRQGLGLRGVASVLGITTRDADLLLIRARELLERALTGEILARMGVADCPDRAAMLTDWDGTLTAPMREQLVKHAGRCAACGQRMPRNVSARKVYGLLPVPEPPMTMQMRTLACFSDPELAGYRAFVAGRAAKFGDSGFPLTPAAAVAAAAAAGPRRPASAHLWVGLAAALAATALGVGLAVSRLELGGDFVQGHPARCHRAVPAGHRFGPRLPAGPCGRCRTFPRAGRPADHADQPARCGSCPWRRTRPDGVANRIASGPTAAAGHAAAGSECKPACLVPVSGCTAVPLASRTIAFTIADRLRIRRPPDLRPAAPSPAPGPRPPHPARPLARQARIQPPVPVSQPSPAQRPADARPTSPAAVATRPPAQSPAPSFAPRARVPPAEPSWDPVSPAQPWPPDPWQLGPARPWQQGDWRPWEGDGWQREVTGRATAGRRGSRTAGSRGGLSRRCLGGIRAAGLVSLGRVDRPSRLADRARSPSPQDQPRTGTAVPGRALRA